MKERTKRRESEKDTRKREIEPVKNTRKANERKWRRIVSRADNAGLFSRVIYNMMVGTREPTNDYNNYFQCYRFVSNPVKRNNATDIMARTLITEATAPRFVVRFAIVKCYFPFFLSLLFFLFVLNYVARKTRSESNAI